MPNNFDQPMALAQSLLDTEGTATVSIRLAESADTKPHEVRPHEVRPHEAGPHEAGPQPFERRSEARYPTHDPAEIEVMPGPSQPIYGTILDVSRSGMRVAVPRRMDRGERIKVTLYHNVIFGEIRYCRPVSGVFHAGVRIQDLVRPPGNENQHIADDPLSLYAVGKGLSVAEVIEVREHLVRCEACRSRLAKKEGLLNPARKRRLLA